MGRSNHLLVEIQQQDTRKNSKLCSKLTIKRVESRSGVLLFYFQFYSVSIVDFKLVNACQEALSCVNIITQSLFSRSNHEQIQYLNIETEGRDVNIIQNSADFRNV